MFDAVKSKLVVLRPPVELEFPNPIEFACVEGVGTAEEDTDILSLLLQLPPLLSRFPSTTLRRARSSLSSASALDEMIYHVIAHGNYVALSRVQESSLRR